MKLNQIYNSIIFSSELEKLNLTNFCFACCQVLSYQATITKSSHDQMIGLMKTFLENSFVNEQISQWIKFPFQYHDYYVDVKRRNYDFTCCNHDTL